MVRNLAKITLYAVLERALKSKLGGKPDPLRLVDVLNAAARKVLGVTFQHAEKKRNLGSFIPNVDQYTAQTIQRLMKAYKDDLYGWKKTT